MALIPVEQDQEKAYGVKEGSDTSDFLARQAGLIARAATTPEVVGAAIGAGAAAPVGLPGAGALAGAGSAFLVDIGAKVYNALIADPTKSNRAPVLSEVLDDIKNQIGLPIPETPIERIQERTVQGATAMIPMMAGGKMLETAARGIPALRRVGAELYKSPEVQTIAGMAGSALSGLAKEAGLGKAGELAAGAAGVLVPVSAARMGSVAKQAAQMGVSKPVAAITGLTGITEPTRLAAIRLLRGGKTQEEIASNLRQFQEAGTIPSAGQATGSLGVQQAENIVGKFPSGFATMRQKGLTQQEEIGRKVEEIRSQLSPVREPELAGRKMGIGFESVFVPQAKSTISSLYKKADSLIPPNLIRINPTETENALNKVLQRFKETPELRDALGNKQLMAIQKSIKSGKNEAGQIPLSTMRDLRTWAGEELSGVNLTPTIEKAQLKLLYGAITKDFDNAVSPFEQTKNAFARANRYTKAYHERMDAVQNILSKQNPEEIYKMVLSGSKDGPYRIRRVLQSVPKDAQKAFVSAFVARMGRAVPSMQDETGEVFSTSRFLNNYASLDKASRKAMFGRFGSQFESDLSKIANVASKIRESSNVLANPSGTSGAVVGPATVASLEGSLAAGKFGFASGMLSVLLQANQAARLFTNPRYVRWLASNIEKPVSGSTAALSTLYSIARSTKDDDISSFIEEVKRQSQE